MTKPLDTVSKAMYGFVDAVTFFVKGDSNNKGICETYLNAYEKRSEIIAEAITKGLGEIAAAIREQQHPA